jgi:hypothetical protein
VFRSVQLQGPGRLLLGGMPGHGEFWEVFQARAEQERLDLILCLTPHNEVAGRSPQYAAAVAAGELPWTWVHVPMPDFGVPADTEAFAAQLEPVVAALRAGQTVLAHCGAGIGRTGTAATCILLALGEDLETARALVSQAGSSPETGAQEDLVTWYAEHVGVQPG